MGWWILALIVVSILAVAAWTIWQKWIAPWADFEALVRQVGRGEPPRTFLLPGARPISRVGVALEEIFRRQKSLESEIGQRVSSTEAILSAMADGLAVVDNRRRVVFGNAALGRMFQIGDVSPGESLLELLRDSGIDHAVEHALQSKQPITGSIALTNPERHLALSAVPMQNESGAVVLFHDISDLKRTDQIRSEFVANVSHELRTPLSILRGYIETLLDDPATPAAELRRILEIMERHTKRLSLLADDLLTLASLESGTVDLKVSPVRLDNLVANVARDWEKRFAEKKLKVSIEVEPQLSPVPADEIRLHEILNNLIDNSVKYSRIGDEIHLRAYQENGSVTLSVSDTGPGISREDLPRIFERFYRGDKARSRELGGTGLGLSIVKHIAQLHGGRAEAESELGRGTTIRVILPVPSVSASLVTQT